MADLRNQRRMAASILKCGEHRIWMDADRIDEIAKAVTRGDVKVLISGGAIKSKQVKGISSGRNQYKQHQKKKGRQQGHGSRRGAKFARLPRKDRWIRTIRPLRSYLRSLRDEKKISPHGYRKYYQGGKRGSTLQGGGTAGGLGIDKEFYESSLIPSIVTYGFIGLDARPEGSLFINPRLPKACPEIALSNLLYRNTRLDIRVTNNTIELNCKDLPAESIRVVLQGIWKRKNSDWTSFLLKELLYKAVNEH